jgi:predicted amidohydrolase
MVPDVAVQPQGPEVRRLVEAAGASALVVGMVEESPQHRFYNAAVYAEGGRIVHVHRKVYLPTYGLFDEQRYFAAGDRIEAFDTARFGRVGILVCEDFWHLSAAAVMQAEEVDLLICTSNSPARGVDGPRIRTAETYELLARAFAQLLGAMVIVVNRVGFEDGLCFWGGSMVVGPDGGMIAQAPMLDPALTVAAFDPAELRRQRLITPLARDERLLLTIEELHRIKRGRYGA